MEKQIRGTRKMMPEWKKRVDQTLWGYSRTEHALSYQQTLIAELEKSALCRRTNLEIRGSVVKKAPQEQVVLELERTRERCQILLKKKENIEQILNWLFPPESEKRTFVEAYWLKCSSTEVQVRAAQVWEKLPFLGEKSEDGSVHGNRNFYYWRNKIYQELAAGFGYLPEPEGILVH